MAQIQAILDGLPTTAALIADQLQGYSNSFRDIRGECSHPSRCVLANYIFDMSSVSVLVEPPTKIGRTRGRVVDLATGSVIHLKPEVEEFIRNFDLRHYPALIQPTRGTTMGGTTGPSWTDPETKEEPKGEEKSDDEKSTEVSPPEEEQSADEASTEA